MTGLRFRNLDASPDDAVATWPFEGIVTAIERGTLPDWRRLAVAVEDDPWGHVAQQVAEAVRLPLPYGHARLFEMVVSEARRAAVRAERAEVASEIRDLVERSGLTQAVFAEGIGTSGSRLSTYLAAKVTPSAALMVRMRRVAARAESSCGLAAEGQDAGQPDREITCPVPSGEPACGVFDPPTW